MVVAGKNGRTDGRTKYDLKGRRLAVENFDKIYCFNSKMNNSVRNDAFKKQHILEEMNEMNEEK